LVARHVNLVYGTALRQGATRTSPKKSPKPSSSSSQENQVRSPRKQITAGGKSQTLTVVLRKIDGEWKVDDFE
jgi:hypothetical protein